MPVLRRRILNTRHDLLAGRQSLTENGRLPKLEDDLSEMQHSMGDY